MSTLGNIIQILALLLLGNLLFAQKDYSPLIRSLKLSAAAYEKDSASVSLTLAEAYNKIAKLYFYQRNYKASQSYFQKELAQRLQFPDTGIAQEKICKAYYNVSVHHRLFSQYPQAMKNAKKALTYAERYYGSIHAEVRDVYKLMGDIAYLWKRPDFQFDFVNKALAIHQQLEEENPEKWIDLMILKAASFVEIDAYEKGEELLLKALQYQKHNHHLDVSRAKIFTNLGSLYQHQDKNTEALDLFKKAINIYLQQDKKQDLALAALYRNAGIAHYYLNQEKAALRCFQQSKDLYQEVLGAKDLNCIRLLVHEAAVYLKNKAYRKAEQCLEKNLNLLEQYYGHSSKEKLLGLQKMASLLVDQGKYKQAFNYCRAAELIFKADYSAQAPELIRFYYNWAYYCALSKDEKKAVFFLKQSMEANEIQTEGAGLKLIDRPLYLMSVELLISQRKALMEEEKWLFARVEKAMQAAEEWYAQQEYKTDKKALINKLRRFYEELMAYYAQKTMLTNKEKAIIFRCFEQSKAVLVAEAVHQQLRYQQLGMTTHQITALKRAEQEAAYFEKQWLDAQVKDSAMHQQRQAAFTRHQQAQQQLKTLKEQLTETYPPFQSMQQAPARWPVTLESQTAYLHYFWGEDKLYLLAFDQQAFLLKSIDLSLAEDLQLLYQELQFNSNSSSDWQATFNRWKQLSSSVSNQLLPVASPIFQQPNWVLFPDAQLYYLPFELLCLPGTDLASCTHYKEIPYLLKSAAINYSYNYHYLTLTEQKKSGDIPLKILAVAPEYQLETEQHRPLSGSASEIQFLRQHFSGKYLFHQQVFKEDVLPELDQYAIVHLAMHAFIPDEAQASLLFSGRKNALLTIDEIAGMQLKDCQLLVLSACQTGIGAYEKGEGVLSLGRAFALSNVSSILLTTWPMHDQSAVPMMKCFYQGLEKGLSKKEALRQAKLQVLNHASKMTQHPSYWGPAVLWGNAEPLNIAKKTKSSAYQLVGISFVMLLAALGFFLLCYKQFFRLTR